MGIYPKDRSKVIKGEYFTIAVLSYTEAFPHSISPQGLKVSIYKASVRFLCACHVMKPVPLPQLSFHSVICIQLDLK